ncbi:MAG TPA: T9SS type B sorting domain-containing protein [Lentimicrobium sp.]|nr:T9SS type B sorting domain-containing protein [Lentimicrobium sp.]
MKKILLILTLLIFTLQCFPQNEALSWFFGNKIYYDFTGSTLPSQGTASAMNAMRGSICMSDRITGAPLFYSNGTTVWNRANNTMPNGVGLYGSAQHQQPGVAIPVPGSTEQYYIITNGVTGHAGAYYTVVDMTLNGGYGDVILNKKNIQFLNEDIQGCIMAYQHPNHKSYWLIFRTLRAPGSFNKLLVYLVSEKGIKFHSETECLTNYGENEYAYSKLSPDGKHYIFTSYNYHPMQPRSYEYYRFDPFTGNFGDKKFWFRAFSNKPGSTVIEHKSNGVEFSADSKFLYTTVQAVDKTVYLKQFDLSRIDVPDFDFTNFENDVEDIAEWHDTIDKWGHLQLARDGKIYVAHGYNKDAANLSRIFYPYKPKRNCDFRVADQNLRLGTESTVGMPVIVPSFLNRFDWTSNCFPDSTHFRSQFIPTPTTITWDFGDGTPPVTGLNPVHKYATTGNYIVAVVAEFNREVEVITREIHIVNKPFVNFVPDPMYVCPGQTVDLNVMTTGDITWFNGDTTNSVTVPAGLNYWVKAENYYGCIASDTVDVLEYLAPTVDNSNLEIFPTTCTGATGYIHGIAVNGVNGAAPFTYIWKDASGNIIYTGPNVNMDNVAAGTYSLSVTDAHGCPWPIQNYTVTSVGDDFVDAVEPSPTYCSADNGTVRVTPDPRFSGLVQYSLDGGPWQLDSLFKDLGPGNHNVRVMIIANPTCIKDWGNVFIDEYPNPIIDSVSTTHELDNNSDGTLDIHIPGADLWYTIVGPSGTIGPQQNSVFTGLLSGTYSCTVYTILSNGIKCTSDPFTVEVPQEWSVMVTGALTAGSPVCVGETITANLKIHNFHGLVHFKTSVTFDRSRLVGQSAYLNLNPALGTVTYNVDNAAGTLEVIWDSPTPLELPDTVQILTMVFNTINPGIAPINWNQTEVELASGIDFHILPNPPFIPTQLLIYASPNLTLSDDETCVGSPVTITASVNPPGAYNYTWTLPNGAHNTSNSITLGTTSTSDEGVYQLVVSDLHTCKDTSDMFLRILPLPDVGFVDDTAYYDVEELLQANEGFAQYIWNTGESTSAIWIRSEGMYSVQVTDYKGCISSDSIQYLSIEKAPFWFYVPTAFTPNNDGINDNFRPVTDYRQIKRFSLKIFDRWGQLIYNTTDAEKGWDGRINGNRIPNGIFLWEMVYKKLDDPTVKVSGHVTMVY